MSDMEYSSPRVSVVIPHFNDLSGLDMCLSALARQTFPARDLEIIVSDNMSPQGEAAVRQTIAGRARFVTSTMRGAGPTRNAGVAVANGALLAFIDSDCIPEPEWLEQGLLALGSRDFVGGRVKVLMPDAGRSGAEIFEGVFAFDNRAYVEKKGFTVTANLFCPRAVFDDTGGFRVGVSEDLEWCHRATAKGYRLGYAPLAVVGHPARPDWPLLLHKWRRINAESYGLVSQTRRGRLGWLLRSWALPLSIVPHAPRMLRSPLPGNASERLAGFGTLVRLRLWRFLDAHRLLMRGR
ncbi:MAG: glycosyltransferase [Sphingomonas sp.]